MEPTIQLYTGSYFNFLHPERNVYDILDIAKALSKICRFTGHTKHFYSVAQHSVLVSHIVPPELAFQGLMHDAAEAYIGDIASPLKQLLPEYKRIETNIEMELFKRFKLPAKLDRIVKDVDLIALATERRDLMDKNDQTVWGIINNITPFPTKIVEMDCNTACTLFLNRYDELTSKNSVDVNI